MRQQRVDPDQGVAAVAARQHGVVTTRQLRDAGLSPDAIKRRAASGRLHRVFRGVYAVGHAGLSDEGRWMAAVLACGRGALLSHRSAAELWGLLEPSRGVVQVSVPTPGGRRARPGLRVHRAASLDARARTAHRGIPVTAPARTLADLGGSVPPWEYRQAVREAAFRGLAADDQEDEVAATRSELELGFLRLCRRHRLPEPEVNVRLGPFTVDFLWRSRRLVVETDGYRAHRGRQAFEDDRERDNELAALGYQVVRFTHRKLVEDPEGAVSVLRARLG
jgi:very-short-patch-repair endonuclease